MIVVLFIVITLEFFLAFFFSVCALAIKPVAYLCFMLKAPVDLYRFFLFSLIELFFFCNSHFTHLSSPIFTICYITFDLPGILLLGELLMRLISKPLVDTAISSLIEFFTERLVSKHFRFRSLPYKDSMRKTRYQLMPLSVCSLVCGSYLCQVSPLLVN